MNVFEYMGKLIKPYTKSDVKALSDIYPKDGNFMVICIKKMQENVDYNTFFEWTVDEMIKKEKLKLWPRRSEHSVWLFGDPAKFFELMEAWLKEGKK